MMLILVAFGKVLFAIGATTAVVSILWYLEEGSWPWYHTRWYRQLIGRCLYCGGMIGHGAKNNEPCLHCSSSIYYGWHACHSCAKTLNFSRLYGAKVTGEPH